MAARRCGISGPWPGAAHHPAYFRAAYFRPAYFQRAYFHLEIIIRQIVDIIKKINREPNTTIFLVEQNAN
ncbi:MAG: hypothetical protein Q8S17_00765, partial [Humidesulfovibrio sp.]|nr:hypothetical protein [Humidesulfovibrio sp.]